jgi:hypothetical protein
MAFWRLVVEDDDGNKTTHIRRTDSVESAKDWGEACFGVGSVVSVDHADAQVRREAGHLAELIEECWHDGGDLSALKEFFLDEIRASYLD